MGWWKFDKAIDQENNKVDKTVKTTLKDVNGVSNSDFDALKKANNSNVLDPTLILNINKAASIT